MFDYLALYLPIMSSYCLGSALIAAICLYALIKKPLVLVEPHARHSHDKATPSSGGLAIFIASAIMIPWVLFTTPAEIFLAPWVKFLLACLLLCSVSFCDDYIHGVRFEFRLLTHTLCALVIVGVPTTMAQWVGIFFTVAIINSANFVDGLNGLLSGSWLICMLSSSLIFINMYPFSTPFLMPFLPICAAVIIFFYYNFVKGKIFMGDVGSTLLGFTLAYLANYVHLRSEVVVWGITREGAMMLMPLAFLAFDVVFTIVSRLIEKRGVTQPHKDYLFHRLLASGLSHRQISSIYFLLGSIMVVLTQLYYWGHITFIVLFGIYILFQFAFVTFIFYRRAVAR